MWIFMQNVTCMRRNEHSLLEVKSFHFHWCTDSQHRFKLCPIFFFYFQTHFTVQSKHWENYKIYLIILIWWILEIPFPMELVFGIHYIGVSTHQAAERHRSMVCQELGHGSEQSPNCAHAGSRHSKTCPPSPWKNCPLWNSFLVPKKLIPRTRPWCPKNWNNLFLKQSNTTFKIGMDWPSGLL